jgi:hypothetical protein
MINETNGKCPKTDHLKLRHNNNKIKHPKTQIISYHPSMTIINIIILIDYHKKLSY